MAFVRNFKTEPYLPNQIALNWLAPIGFNDTTEELIVTRTITHFPMELFNTSFPTKATDSTPIEIYRGRTIIGTSTSIIGNTIYDSSKTPLGENLPINPPLKGRLLRDSNSKVHRIKDNTIDTITLETTPASGKYIILPDFPEIIRNQENYELDTRTEVGVGYIKNLVILENGSPIIKLFTDDEVANLIFKDGAGNKFLIKSNNSNTLYFFENSVPVLGTGMAILNSFYDSTPFPYIDNFLTEEEASTRTGSGLLDDQFYYYTIFNQKMNTNVAQAQFSAIDSGTPTQSVAISIKNINFGDILFNKYWPSLYRYLDTTGDLKDLMDIFGIRFNELYSLIKTYNLQDTHKVYINALQPLSEQTGLPSIGFSIGADTLRRIANDLLTAWKLKGSKEGIALFIRILTTWDITDGTGDYSSAIEDFLPNISALRFFDENLGITNVRLTSTDPYVPGGRFAKSLPGIIIPGFFTFREYVITIPNVALYIGTSKAFTVSNNTTTLIDEDSDFGTDNSLVGNFLLSNQEEVNDIYEIISNTKTTITVRGLITNREIGGTYVVLSPLNTNRFIILNKLLPIYQPFGTMAGFRFI